MDTKLLVPAIGWLILTSAVIALAIYRLALGTRQDDHIHLRASDMAMTSTQMAFAHKLEKIERTGKALTVAAVLYGAALVAWLMWDAWITRSLLPR